MNIAGFASLVNIKLKFNLPKKTLFKIPLCYFFLKQNDMTIYCRTKKILNNLQFHYKKGQANKNTCNHKIKMFDFL